MSAWRENIGLLRGVVTDWSRDTREWKISTGDAERALDALTAQIEEMREALDLVRPHLAKSGCFDAETVDAVHRALGTKPRGE